MHKMLESKKEINKKDRSFSINSMKKFKLINKRLYLSLEGDTDLYY